MSAANSGIGSQGQANNNQNNPPEYSALTGDDLGSDDSDDSDYVSAGDGGEVDIDIEFTDDLMEMDENEEDEDNDEEEDDGEDEDNDEDENEERVIEISPQLFSMLQTTTGRALFQALRSQLGPLRPQRRSARLAGNRASSQDEDDDDGTGWSPFAFGGSRRRKKTPRVHELPDRRGIALMRSGLFGRDSMIKKTYTKRRSAACWLFNRELGLDGGAKLGMLNGMMAQTMIPSGSADKIIDYNARCYSGQFSQDGNFYFCCDQDYNVRLYDTTNPYDWKYYKCLEDPFGKWTITDATLSPNNKQIAYSSITPTIRLASTDPEDTNESVGLRLTGGNSQEEMYSYWHETGVWSVRFSGDGNELIAGTTDNSIYVYDLTANRTVLKIGGHTEHVNAVCYGDAMSPHILYSGSDDSTIRVWDRRSLADKRPAGVFLGHLAGLTYIDSKGDGRYVLSNGKDQTMKLWDLRKMSPASLLDEIEPGQYADLNFDYRSGSFDEDCYDPHPHDTSVMTYRGHTVLNTLIRCHFSPPGSTDSRYVYSGSTTGSVHIYNLDGTKAQIIDVNAATSQKRRRPRDLDMYSASHNCVRDASWHPSAPIIAATSWAGMQRGSAGACTIHTWNAGLLEDEDELGMSQQYNAKLVPVPTYVH